VLSYKSIARGREILFFFRDFNNSWEYLSPISKKPKTLTIMKTIKTTTLLAAAFAFVGSLQADVIIPTTVIANQAGLSDRGVGTIIDGSGLSGSGDILTQTHVLSDESPNNQYYITGGANTVTFDFSFDSAYDVDSIHLWQYVNQGSGTIGYRQINQATFTFSTDDGATFGSSTGLLSFSAISNSVGLGNVPVQTVSFGSTISGVTDIKMVADANFSGSDRLALAEVRFDGVAVPEPSAFGLLAGCFGFAWVMLRRRG